MKQFIKCPECGSIELATIETSPIFYRRHRCSKCKFVIMENKWNPVPAISIRQPWAWLICSGIKNIENRTWKLPEKHKGEKILIHTGAKIEDINKIFSDEQWNVMGEKGRIGCILLSTTTSSIIGSVEIIDCVVNHESIWAEKTNFMRGDKPIYNWVLSNPVLFDNPIPCKGKLSFFIPEID